MMNPGHVVLAITLWIAGATLCWWIERGDKKINVADMLGQKGFTGRLIWLLGWPVLHLRYIIGRMLP